MTAIAFENFEMVISVYCHLVHFEQPAKISTRRTIFQVARNKIYVHILHYIIQTKGLDKSQSPTFSLVTPKVKLRFPKQLKQL